MADLTLPTPNKTPGDGAPADDTNLIIEAINTLNSAVEGLPAGPVGPAGPQGPQGVQGPQGDTGPTGAQGPTGSQGIQGPAGVQGPIGDTGPQGPQGDSINVLGTKATVAALPSVGNYPGDAWVVDSDGHLYIWNGGSWTDGGTFEGPQGAQGIQGIQGPTGATGATGPTGPAGPTGPQGPIGETGAQGIQGIKGDTGDQGPQGIQGIQGIQGVKGDTGDTGPQGPQGNPTTVNGLTGASITLTAADVGAAPSSGISPSAITGTAVVTSDSRLSDARTPTAHAVSHQTGGSDALTLAANQITGTAIVQSVIDAKGDLIVGTADNTLTRLAVGATNGFVLTVDSAQATGLTWAVAAAPVDDPLPVVFFLGGM